MPEDSSSFSECGSCSKKGDPGTDNSQSHVLLGKHIGIAAEEVAIPGYQGPLERELRMTGGIELKKSGASPHLWGSQGEAEQAPVSPSVNTRKGQLV